MANKKRKIIRRKSRLDIPLLEKSIEDNDEITEQGIAENDTSFNSGNEVDFNEEISNQDGIISEKDNVIAGSVKHLNDALNRAVKVALTGVKPGLIGVFGLNYDVVIGNA